MEALEQYLQRMELATIQTEDVLRKAQHLIDTFDALQRKAADTTQAYTKLKESLKSNKITQTQAAAILGVTSVSLGRWRKAGIIPVYRVGKRWKYKESEVIAFLNKKKNGR